MHYFTFFPLFTAGWRESQTMVVVETLAEPIDKIQFPAVTICPQTFNSDRWGPTLKILDYLHPDFYFNGYVFPIVSIPFWITLCFFTLNSLCKHIFLNFWYIDLLLCGMTNKKCQSIFTFEIASYGTIQIIGNQCFDPFSKISEVIKICWFSQAQAHHYQSGPIDQFLLSTYKFDPWYFCIPLIKINV